jgi:hypothetical protein
MCTARASLFPVAATEWLLYVGLFGYDTVVFKDLLARRGKARFEGTCGITCRITGRSG